MIEALDLSKFVERSEPGCAHITLAVEGVGCAGCIRKIEDGLQKLPGIVNARLNFTQRRLAVEWRDSETNAERIVAAIEQIGYRAYPFAPERIAAEDNHETKWLLKCLAVAGFAAMNVMLLSVSIWAGNVSDMMQETRDLFHWLSALIALPAAAYAGQPFFKSAWRAIGARQLNMNVPITAGVILALGLSLYETATHAVHAYFDSAIMLVFFLLCGRYLDRSTRQKTRQFAGNLASSKAEFAHRFGPRGELSRVPASALQRGDCILVQPGEAVPADGLVASGQSEVDQSLVTGETIPQPVEPGMTIYAGAINCSGALTIRVAAAGSSTLLQEIERLLLRATEAKSRTVRLADRAARLYAPIVHLTAAATAVGWLLAGASLHDAIVTAVAVLIITCPCAIALAIPTVQVVAAGRLFRAGIILNSGDAIERLGTADTVIFDKTGTLTLPEGVVDGSSVDPDILERAARLALSSHHPLAAALARCARERIPYAGVIEDCGNGVRGNIEGQEARLGSAPFCGLTRPSSQNKAANSAASTIFFTHAGRVAGIPICQRLRPDAVTVVKALIGRRLDLMILSGDRPNAVEPIARQLGITQWYAGLSPAEKIATIEKLKALGRRVLMIGDGLNDAPALAAATVSLSPITAAQLTQTRADALFLGDYLVPVLDAIALSRRARSLMQENLGLAIIYNALAVPIAVAGLANPLIAAAAMSGSSILVTLNALRGRLGRRPEVHATGVAPTQADEQPAPSKARVTESRPKDRVLESAAAARDRLEYVR